MNQPNIPQSIKASSTAWKIRSLNITLELILSLLILLWIYTGLNKYLDYSDFKHQLGRSPFIKSMATFLAITLPTGELLIALALLFKRTRAVGLYSSYLMMLLFTGYIWVMLHYSYDLPCSCGGVLEQMTWPQHFVFNACFTVLAFLGIIIHRWKQVHA